MTTDDLQKQNAELKAEIAEYKTQTGCPHCRRVDAQSAELTTELSRVKAELDNLAQQVRHASNLLRESASPFDEACRKLIAATKDL